MFVINMEFKQEEKQRRTKLINQCVMKGFLVFCVVLELKKVLSQAASYSKMSYRNICMQRKEKTQTRVLSLK